MHCLAVEEQLFGGVSVHFRVRPVRLVVFGNSSHSEDLMTDFANKTLKEGKAWALLWSGGFVATTQESWNSRRA